MINASRPAPYRFARSGQLRAALVVVAAMMLASACAGGETTVTGDQAGKSRATRRRQTRLRRRTVPPSQTDPAAAQAVDEGARDAEETFAEANGQLWPGPDWLDLPAGFTVTWGYPREADLDGLVQGDLAANLGLGGRRGAHAWRAAQRGVHAGQRHAGMDRGRQRRW